VYACEIFANYYRFAHFCLWCFTDAIYLACIFLINNTWCWPLLSFCCLVEGYMRLMCTAILSSQCLSCFMVSVMLICVSAFTSWILVYATTVLLMSWFCCSYTLFPVTPSSGPWFHTCIAVEPAVHGGSLVLSLPQLFRLLWWAKFS